jgi:hypothetical protein
MGTPMGVERPTAEQIFRRVIDALHALDVQYMLVGSFSSNFYGVPRSTQDLDLVLELANTSPTQIADALGPDFQFDPQMSFETITGTYRFVASHQASPFKVEFFLLSDDPHDRRRFARRRAQSIAERQTFVPSPEDVIVTKLRWSKGGNRKKDVDDVRNVMRVQRKSVDWGYVEHWCDIHGTRELLDRLRLEATQSDEPGPDDTEKSAP